MGSNWNTRIPTSKFQIPNCVVHNVHVRSRCFRALVVSVAVVLAGAVAACRREAPPRKPPEPQIIWRAVGSWSGHGNRQTESFTSDTGALRVKWETKAIRGAAAPGSFRLEAHSAISGRILQQVVEHRGPGSGVDYVSQDPHVFYMSVDSDGLDWKISVDEGIAGEIVGGGGRR